TPSEPPAPGTQVDTVGGAPSSSLTLLRPLKGRSSHRSRGDSAHWSCRVDRAVRLTRLVDRLASYIVNPIGIGHSILSETFGKGVAISRVRGVTVSRKQFADFLDILKF